MSLGGLVACFEGSFVVYPAIRGVSSHDEH